MNGSTLGTRIRRTGRGFTQALINWIGCTVWSAVVLIPWGFFYREEMFYVALVGIPIASLYGFLTMETAALVPPESFRSWFVRTRLVWFLHVATGIALLVWLAPAFGQYAWLAMMGYFGLGGALLSILAGDRDERKPKKMRGEEENLTEEEAQTLMDEAQGDLPPHVVIPSANGKHSQASMSNNNGMKKKYHDEWTTATAELLEEILAEDGRN